MPNPSAGLALAIDPEALRPLIARIVSETIAAVQAQQAQAGDRLAYTEAEAARMLGLAVHQLRDERLRGRIAASRIVGSRIRYLREDLMRYLAARRVEGGAA